MKIKKSSSMFDSLLLNTMKKAGKTDEEIKKHFSKISEKSIKYNNLMHKENMNFINGCCGFCLIFLIGAFYWFITTDKSITKMSPETIMLYFIILIGMFIIGWYVINKKDKENEKEFRKTLITEFE